MARFLNYLKWRDPGARGHRQQFLNIELTKYATSTWFVLIGVILSIVYDQVQDPSRVKLPIQDGRSNVI